MSPKIEDRIDIKCKIVLFYKIPSVKTISLTCKQKKLKQHDPMEFEVDKVHFHGGSDKT